MNLIKKITKVLNKTKDILKRVQLYNIFDKTNGKVTQGLMTANLWLKTKYLK